MDTKALLKKVRKIEIKTRRLSNHLFGGEYQSTFKGRGMTFSEVRPYQFGDDVLHKLTTSERQLHFETGTHHRDLTQLSAT